MRSRMHNRSKMLNKEEAFTIELFHQNTPDSLRPINNLLSDALAEFSPGDDSGIDNLTSIVSDRAILVKKLLSELQQQSLNSTPPENSEESVDVKAFAEAEYAINSELESFIDALKNKVISDIASLNKSRKAIGEYTGHNVKLHQRTSSQR